jgi:hypothetical protein
LLVLKLVWLEGRHGLDKREPDGAEKKYLNGGEIEKKKKMPETPPVNKNRIAKIATIVAFVASVYALGGHLYSDFESNLQKIKDAAAKQALTDRDRMNYRAAQELFKDSVRKSFRELYLKEHLKSKF